MSRAHYYIAQVCEGWLVRHNFENYSYRTRQEAMRAAVDAAYKSGQNGHDARVLVLGEDGKWQTAWRYGYDLYPPR